ncbi:RICIN domain-containing protein [Micromonospora sp. WMMD1120]|uniref:RICIN domain-containing protein n=1 Tax=Micromonospora sp. WMMD1120 TaxID=3016106 RepID=UPI0024181251|nr:RICIN domain-containing protein [Micromonospora sp. WMMD1120]MDG4809456.1 RICIN domain-containing protein [Micromonospora sp. WMMD1120]
MRIAGLLPHGRGWIAGLIAVGVAAAVGAGVIAYAGQDDLVGRPLSDEQMSAVLAAGHACPMLSSARVAGQLMAESGLAATATRTESGGSGLAGLDEQQWRRWTPWQGAQRTEPVAAVAALTHLMCQLSGEIRQSGVKGDPWRLALAGFRVGVPAVTEAGGVPDAASEYVRRAVGYASHYQGLPHFASAGAGALTAAAVPDAVPLPDALVPPIARVGRRCPQVPAAAVAGQLMAVSGLRTDPPDAAVPLELWQRYAPAKASRADAADVIGVLGAGMCQLAQELDGLPGDPYLLALAAWHSGEDTVRRAGGVPDAMTQSFLERVRRYTDYYRLDTRLGAASGPAPSPSASRTPSGFSSATPGRPTAAPPSPPSRKPAPPQPTPRRKPAGTMFAHGRSGSCLDAGAATDLLASRIESCDPYRVSQRWNVRSDGTIRSARSGLCLDVNDSGVTDGTIVQTATCNSAATQRWTVRDNALISVVNGGMCLDIGWDLATTAIWTCNYDEDQTWRPTT